MTSGSFRFDRFLLDPDERQLRRDGEPVELNARYLDALALLVREPGKLVSKERFLDEVWRGVPVTDEALTQCVKTLRRQLGDDAARPRFIETVPKHGYRFVAHVERVNDSAARPNFADRGDRGLDWRQFALLGGAGTLGAGVAGVVGGLFYGLVGASQAMGTGIGAASILLVLLWITAAAALMGGCGVSLGIAAAGFARSRIWIMVGAALGGLLVGGAVKLLGVDAFNLLLGRSPGDITGAPEGLLLGTATGIGAWIAARNPGFSLHRQVGIAGLCGAAAGFITVLTGGRLMGGSLDLLAQNFPASRLRLDDFGSAFGDEGFGLVSQLVTAGFEGMLFAGCTVGALVLARRNAGA